MKNYTITVNGTAYEVTVEENGQGSAPAAPRKEPVMPKTAAPAPAAKPAPLSGGLKIEAGASGKVFKIEAPVGTKVKTGDPVVILEIMKMETPVVAPKDGTVASIDVSVGQSVEAGELLATMNE